jgi:hypothetical protein
MNLANAANDAKTTTTMSKAIQYRRMNAMGPRLGAEAITSS